ncbi:dihydrofolate reductase family protein [Jiella sonneratiae]|uniref:Dihydrofolate reductase n=1 Tax=Jiella sonneratiae TaxID=2816856 RepID=A0ABS3JCA9_9HYPH|nr:dihydrofolate reductase family protein [Jiella sonneratiae]MBO0906206.1 dihydrofolate reductase [Jiella sonneratiae]
MRQIIAGLFQSLDGVVQAPGGPREDESDGFRFGGWLVPHFSEVTGGFIDEVFSGAFDLVLGRRTYEIFAAHWPRIENDPFADKFNRAAKYVLTSSDAPLAWNNSHRLKDFAAVRALKETDGPRLIVQGSSTIYPGLLQEGLIDRLFLLTFPIILGRGKRALPGAMPTAFSLVESRVSESGVIIAVYEPKGDVETGSFALET